MIPKVKRWKISFYRFCAKTPYASVYVSAPTKTLARLNAVHNADTCSAILDAMRQNPARITYGVVRTGRESAL